MNLLIADSGSTKADWRLIELGNVTGSYSTEGYNPYFLNSEQISDSINKNLLHQIKGKIIDEIHFYGSGCSNPEKNKTLEYSLQNAFPTAKVLVSHDLLGAAKALLGNEKGFAAILGTGANTGLYDGKEIILNIDSLGYILGDEGSGSYIGRKLLREYLRRQLTPTLQTELAAFCKLDHEEILDRVFNKPLPNRFLASFAQFVNDRAEDPFCSKIIHESFNDFFQNLVTRYPGHEKYSFNCVGTVGFRNKNALTKMAADFGMQTGKIIQSPIEGLIEYHTQRN